MYAKDGLSLYEVDGAEHKLYAQNLSLFAKLFLDTKSVFYDVTTFLYYLLVLDNPTPSIASTRLGTEGEGGEGGGAVAHGQVVGFFSKEKMSWDNNNLACICIFPPWQKQGLGQVLMAASYELGRHEGRMGGPEKRTSPPIHSAITEALGLSILTTLYTALSDLGRLAYMHYWSQTLARTILEFPSKKTLQLTDIRDETYIAVEDIIVTLQAMDVLEQKKRGGAEAVINKAKVKAWVERNRLDLRNPVDPEAFIVEASEEGESEDEGDDAGD